MMNNQLPNPDDEADSKRLMIAIAASLAILLLSSFFFKPHDAKNAAAPAAQVQSQSQVPSQAQTNGKASDSKVVKVEDSEKILSHADALKVAKRIQIKGDKVSGSLSLKGARFDDISLNDFYKTIENKENVELLTPYGTSDAYYMESGWISKDSTAAVPNGDTMWRVADGSANVLKSGGEITLEWDNGQGLLFQRNIKLDSDYMFTVTQKIINKTNIEKTFNAWNLISRRTLPEGYKGMFVLHEGPIAYVNNKLHEVNYKDLDKGESFNQDNVRGWFGFTDTYWFAGILTEQNEVFDSRVIGTRANNGKTMYQADMVSEAHSVLPGKSLEDKKYFYVGAKNLELSKQYEKTYQLKKLDLVLDFGMFYFITKPFFILLHMLMDTSGSVGLAIILMTVIVRMAVFPLANTSFRSMAKMKQVAPQLKELQDKYKDQREKLQAEIFALYKREGANPFSGCWPLLIQIPIFFSLYKSIMLSVELRHAPFWGWIHDLSAPDPTSILSLFGLLPWDGPSAMHLGAWPVIFCLTMLWQRRMSPPLPDQTQEQVQNFMPYFVTIMLANFSVGLVIYWTFSNVLGILQQYYIYRSMGDTNISIVGHKDRRKKTEKKDK